MEWVACLIQSCQETVRVRPESGVTRAAWQALEVGAGGTCVERSRQESQGDQNVCLES